VLFDSFINDIPVPVLGLYLIVTFKYLYLYLYLWLWYLQHLWYIVIQVQYRLSDRLCIVFTMTQCLRKQMRLKAVLNLRDVIMQFYNVKSRALNVSRFTIIQRKLRPTYDRV